MSTPKDAVDKANEAMSAMGYTKGANGRWGMPASAAGAAKPASQADAETQAQAAIAGGADKAAVNARLKSLGFAPIK